MSIADPQRVLALLQAFIQAPSWTESQRVVESAPELLTDEADALLARLLEENRDDPQAVRILTEHRDLLRRCRAEGVGPAFGAKMGVPPDMGEVPQEMQPILQELGRPARRADMPRRIELCRQALRLVERGQNPPLWAALQNGLANSLAQTPLGERAENIERAIEHYSQVGEESLDLGSAHFARMSFVVEQDVAFDPVNVGLFGADGVVFNSDGVTHLVE